MDIHEPPSNSSQIVTKDFEDKKEPEKKLTREQRRFMERLEKEARQTHANLSEKFFNFIVDSDDPEGQEVVDKMNQICALWKLYCSRKQLNKSAYNLLDQECQILIKLYLEKKSEGILIKQ